MMSLWDALRMNMMISYQELVRTFLSNSLGDIYHGSVDPRRDGCAFKRAVNPGARVMVSCRPVFGFTFLGVKEFAGRVDQHC